MKTTCRLMLSNLTVALHLFWVPIVIACLLVCQQTYLRELIRSGAREAVSTEHTMAALLLIVLGILLFMRAAVAWHRWLMLGERNRWLWPRYPENEAAKYFARALLLLLLSLCVFVAVSFVMWLAFILLTLIFGQTFLASLLLLIPSFFLLFLFLIYMVRVNVSLIAVALGKNVPLQEVISRLSSANGVIFLTCLPLLLLMTRITTTSDQAPAEPVVLGVAALPLPAQLVIGVLACLYWLTLLTTLYARYVEGRAL
ncbi:hypothetical protein SAMN06297129_0474 [Pseudooceanicola antarcticus]|nr:hypothetical protein SAMN06297129_0474 [Pseudooceanicola antarcticus]